MAPRMSSLPCGRFSPDGDGRPELVWLEDRTFSTGEVLADLWDLDTPATADVGWRMPRADARHSAVAQAVGRITTLTDGDRDRTMRANGDVRFRITTGAQGIIQIVHDWQAAVTWALGGDLLQTTPNGWGGPRQAQPLTQYILHVHADRPTNIRLSWW
jgi:hypothetical protein